jgi:hypothetical protein
MTNNLILYEQFRAVPTEAQKAIGGGRLKGMTDINPMWRIKTITEAFGPVGIGWKIEITRQWIEAGAAGVMSAFCNINLYIKHDGAWSEPIPGTGGAAFVDKETAGLYTSDECFKKAFTDAISVACKLLGVGANVYWDKDSTKYDRPAEPPKAMPREQVAAAKAAVYQTTPEQEAKRTELIAQIETECRARKKKYGGDLHKLTADELSATLAQLIGA